MSDKKALPIGKKNKFIGRMKDELGGKVKTKLVALKAKMYAFRKLDKKVRR